jgi:hypothetical protein
MLPWEITTRENVIGLCGTPGTLPIEFVIGWQILKFTKLWTYLKLRPASTTLTPLSRISNATTDINTYRSLTIRVESCTNVRRIYSLWQTPLIKPWSDKAGIPASSSQVSGHKPLRKIYCMRFAGYAYFFSCRLFLSNILILHVRNNH